MQGQTVEILNEPILAVEYGDDYTVTLTIAGSEHAAVPSVTRVNLGRDDLYRIAEANKHVQLNYLAQHKIFGSGYVTPYGEAWSRVNRVPLLS